MVIEYSGNVIRSVLTDKREKFYDGKVCLWEEHNISLLDLNIQHITCVLSSQRESAAICFVSMTMRW